MIHRPRQPTTTDLPSRLRRAGRSMTPGAKPKWTARRIELAVAHHFGYRANVIVPNVSWGLDLHECDLLMLRPSGWAEEIEIKTTVADFRRDQRKLHQHKDNKIGRLWFAVPDHLGDVVCADAAHDAGVLAVYERTTYDSRRHPRESTDAVRVLRTAAINKQALKFSDAERTKLLHLGAMRIWTLKAALQRFQSEPK